MGQQCIIFIEPERAEPGVLISPDLSPVDHPGGVGFLPAEREVLQSPVVHNPGEIRVD